MNGETKSFFEYVLERIEKSYKEKVTCSVEFRDIVIISSFKIKITILSDDYSKDLDSLDFEINEKYYSAVGIKEEFYKKNPEWTNENLRTKYSNRGKV